MSLNSITSGFQYTNKTATTHKSVSLYDMKEVENYALIKDEPNVVKLENITAPVDAGELLTYRGKKVATVNTELSIPKKTNVVNKGVQYAIQLEADYVSKSDSDDSFRQDDPVIAYLTIIHPLSGYITNDVVGEHVERLISSCKKEDGTWRFNELMRLALKPTED